VKGPNNNTDAVNRLVTMHADRIIGRELLFTGQGIIKSSGGKDIILIPDGDGKVFIRDKEVSTGGGGGGGQTDTVQGASGIANTGDNVDAVLAPNYGVLANTICEGNDSRLSDARTPLGHAAAHQDGGTDEISVAGLSGVLADDQNPVDHASDHENTGGDEINVAGLSGLLADDQNPVNHASDHTDGTDDIQDATTGQKGLATSAHITMLEDHSLRHENGGADEISVAGLSGVLADDQNPVDHAPAHEDGGSDEIDVTDLSGLLADSQTPLAHEASHRSGGADELSHSNLAGLSADDHSQYYNKARLGLIKPDFVLKVDPSFPADDSVLGQYQTIPSALTRADALVVLNPTKWVHVQIQTNIHPAVGQWALNHQVILDFQEWCLIDMSGYVGSAPLIKAIGTNVLKGFVAGDAFGVNAPGASYTWVQVVDTGDARIPLLFMDDCWMWDNGGLTDSMVEVTDGLTNRVNCNVRGGRYAMVPSGGGVGQIFKAVGDCTLDIDGYASLGVIGTDCIRTYAGAGTGPNIVVSTQQITSLGHATTIDVSAGGGRLNGGQGLLLDDVTKVGGTTPGDLARVVNTNQIFSDDVLPSGSVFPTDYKLGNVLAYLKNKIWSGHAHTGGAEGGSLVNYWSLQNRPRAAAAESDGESTTTATGYQQKLLLTTPVLAAGTYKISFYCEHKSDDGTNDGSEARVDLDSGTIIAETESMNASPGGFAAGDGHWLAMGGFREVVLTAAAHTIEIDYRQTTSNTARIRRARIYVERVA